MLAETATASAGTDWTPFLASLVTAVAALVGTFLGVRLQMKGDREARAEERRAVQHAERVRFEVEAIVQAQAALHGLMKTIGEVHTERAHGRPPGEAVPDLTHEQQERVNSARFDTLLASSRLLDEEVRSSVTKMLVAAMRVLAGPTVKDATDKYMESTGVMSEAERTTNGRLQQLFAEGETKA